MWYDFLSKSNNCPSKLISLILYYTRTSLVGQLVKNLLAMQETWVLFLGREDSLEKEMATHSSVLTWRIPWTEEPGGLQPWGCRVRYNSEAKQQQLNLGLQAVNSVTIGTRPLLSCLVITVSSLHTWTPVSVAPRTLLLGGYPPSLSCRWPLPKSLSPPILS